MRLLGCPDISFYWWKYAELFQASSGCRLFDQRTIHHSANLTMMPELCFYPRRKGTILVRAWSDREFRTFITRPLSVDNVRYYMMYNSPLYALRQSIIMLNVQCISCLNS